MSQLAAVGNAVLLGDSTCECDPRRGEITVGRKKWQSAIPGRTLHLSRVLARVFNQLARLNVLENKLEEAKKTNADASELAGLERQIEKAAKIRPFKYTHQGSLAYIGSEKAIADIPLLGNNQIASGGVVTFMFWRSAYVSMLFSLRNRSLVAADWFKVFLFGRDVSRE